mgnify:FL=1
MRVENKEIFLSVFRELSNVTALEAAPRKAALTENLRNKVSLEVLYPLYRFTQRHGKMDNLEIGGGMGMSTVYWT